MFFSSLIPRPISEFYFAFVSCYHFPTLHQGETSGFITAVHKFKVVQTILEGTRLNQKNALHSMYKKVPCMYSGVKHSEIYR